MTYLKHDDKSESYGQQVPEEHGVVTILIPERLIPKTPVFMT